MIASQLWCGLTENSYVGWSRGFLVETGSDIVLIYTKHDQSEICQETQYPHYSVRKPQLITFDITI